MSNQMKQGTKNVRKRLFNDEKDANPVKKGKLAGLKKAAGKVVTRKLGKSKQIGFVPKFDKPMTRARSAKLDTNSAKTVNANEICIAKRQISH